MIYGYARVSTSGQKLETQISLLKKAGVDKIFKEKYTGMTMNRPVLKKLLSALQEGDQLTVTKIDRFARNTSEALSTIESLFKKGVSINILNYGILKNDPSGKLTTTLFSAVAQFDRDMIVARTQEGKAFAKEHDPDFHEGRPETYSAKQIERAYKLHQQGLSYKIVSKKTGISRSTLIRRFKKVTEKIN